MAVKHAKTSTIPDGGDPDLVRPSDWNADHTGTNPHDHSDSSKGGTVPTSSLSGSLPASSISIADAGGLYSGSTVEDALQEAFVPIVLYAESNTPGDSTGAMQRKLEFDTFYDMGFNDTPDIPSGDYGVEYEDGVFTFTESGIWTASIGVSLEAAPGAAGFMFLSYPGWGFSPEYRITASGNSPSWVAEKTFAANPSDQIYLIHQMMSGGDVATMSYAVLDLVRLTKTVR